MGMGEAAPPSTGYLLWRVATHWRIAMDRALTPLGFGHAQYAVLASLAALTAAGSRPSQRELADFCCLEPMHVSKVTRGLERAGLVRRGVRQADPRAYELGLTERGHEVLETALGIVRDLHDTLLEPLGGRAGKPTAELDATLRVLLTHVTDVNATGRNP